MADFIGESNIMDGLMYDDFKVQFAGNEFECVDKGFGQMKRVDVVVRPEDVDKYLASCRVQHVPVAQIIPRAARKAARDMAPEYYPGMRVV